VVNVEAFEKWLKDSGLSDTTIEQVIRCIKSLHNVLGEITEDKLFEHLYHKSNRTRRAYMYAFNKWKEFRECVRHSVVDT